jgi:hypothetical protein
MKTLFTIILVAVTGLVNAQIYLEVDFQPPSTQVSNDGILSAQLMNYPGSVDYSIEITDPFTSTSYAVVGNYIDTIKYNSAIAVYAVDGADTVGVYLNLFLASGAATDTASLSLTGMLESMTPITCDGALSYQSNLSSAQLTAANYSVILESVTEFSDANRVPVNSSSLDSDVFSNLCPGKYFITLGENSQSNFASMTSLIINSQLMGNNNPTYNVQVEHSVNAIDSCYATAQANVVGTTGPYQFSYDGNNYTYDSVATDLCSGLHLLRIIDTGNDTLVKYFSVADSSQFLSQNNGGGVYVDSISVDFQNCNFDYNTPVDSANILSIDSVSTDTYSWTIEIWQNGTYNVYTDTITMSIVMNGLNQCYVTIFCPVKAGGSKTFKFSDSYLYGANTSGIAENTSNFSVFPNPVDNSLNFLGNDASSFVVTDLTGKKVMQGKVNRNQINVFDLSQGAYLFTLLDDTGNVMGVTKFIKR